MAENGKEQLEQKLAEIQKRYAGKMQAKLEDLEKAMAAYRIDYQKKDELYRQVHTLAGSAQTFGFHQVSKSAQAAEDMLTKENCDQKELQARLDQLLNTMRSAL